MGFHLVSSVVSHQMISLEYYWVLPSFVGIQRRWRTWASGCSLMRNFLRLKDNLRTLAHEKVLILAKFWKTSTPTLATARFNGTPSGSCDRPMSIGFTPGSSQLVRFRRLFTGFFLPGFVGLLDSIRPSRASVSLSVVFKILLGLAGFLLWCPGFTIDFTVHSTGF